MFSTKIIKSSCFLTNQKSVLERTGWEIKKKNLSHRLESTDPSEIRQELMIVQFRVQIVHPNQNKTTSDSLLWLMLYFILTKNRKT